ncbi:hypothetical protein AG0111_0g13091 [Alternaria gaisen]|uniref:Uncharacterized protein n=1 Tax=Alternaria gaisen TaxID=167740 RepID=A0ACB6F2K7_9PLEO|nr:hypothetical protein AG0111_0g13091 [Alternaria gaisen]
MQFLTTAMATLMLGGALLPTAFAAKYPCEIGNSRNRGESCSNEGWYGCSNNLKHTLHCVNGKWERINTCAGLCNMPFSKGRKCGCNL